MERRSDRRSERRRSSSILKINKSPSREALSELHTNAVQEDVYVPPRRKSRRVSFAETCQVKEFLIVKSHPNALQDAAPQVGMSSAGAGIQGLESLLTGPISGETQPPHYESHTPVMEVPMPNDSTLSECASVEGMDHTHSQTMDMTTAKGHISMGPGGLNHTQSQSMEMTMANGRISMGPAGLDKTQSQSSMEMTMPSGRISLGPGGLNLTQSQTMDMTVAKGRISLGPGSLDHSHSRAMEMTLAEGHSSKVQGDLNSTAMDMTLPVGLLQMGQPNASLLYKPDRQFSTSASAVTARQTSSQGGQPVSQAAGVSSVFPITSTTSSDGNLTMELTCQMNDPPEMMSNASLSATQVSMYRRWDNESTRVFTNSQLNLTSGLESEEDLIDAKSFLASLGGKKTGSAMPFSMTDSPANSVEEDTERIDAKSFLANISMNSATANNPMFVSQTVQPEQPQPIQAKNLLASLGLLGEPSRDASSESLPQQTKDTENITKSSKPFSFSFGGQTDVSEVGSQKVSATNMLASLGLITQKQEKNKPSRPGLLGDVTCHFDAQDDTGNMSFTEVFAGPNNESGMETDQKPHEHTVVFGSSDQNDMEMTVVLGGIGQQSEAHKNRSSVFSDKTPMNVSMDITTALGNIKSGRPSTMAKPEGLPPDITVSEDMDFTEVSGRICNTQKSISPAPEQESIPVNQTLGNKTQITDDMEFTEVLGRIKSRPSVSSAAGQLLGNKTQLCDDGMEFTEVLGKVNSRRSISPAIGQENMPLKQTVSNQTQICDDGMEFTEVLGKVNSRRSISPAIGQENSVKQTASNQTQICDDGMEFTEVLGKVNTRRSISPAIGQENSVKQTASNQTQICDDGMEFTEVLGKINTRRSISSAIGQVNISVKQTASNQTQIYNDGMEFTEVLGKVNTRRSISPAIGQENIPVKQPVSNQTQICDDGMEFTEVLGKVNTRRSISPAIGQENIPVKQTVSNQTQICDDGIEFTEVLGKVNTRRSISLAIGQNDIPVKQTVSDQTQMCDDGMEFTEVLGKVNTRRSISSAIGQENIPVKQTVSNQTQMCDDGMEFTEVLGKVNTRRSISPAIGQENISVKLTASNQTQICNDGMEFTEVLGKVNTRRSISPAIGQENIPVKQTVNNQTQMCDDGMEFTEVLGKVNTRRSISPAIGQENIPVKQTVSNQTQICDDGMEFTEVLGKVNTRRSISLAIGQNDIPVKQTVSDQTQMCDDGVEFTEVFFKVNSRRSISPAIGQENVPLNQTVNNRTNIAGDGMEFIETAGKISSRQSISPAIGQENMSLKQTVNNQTQVCDYGMESAEVSGKVNSQHSISPATGQENMPVNETLLNCTQIGNDSMKFTKVLGTTDSRHSLSPATGQQNIPGNQTLSDRTQVTGDGMKFIEVLGRSSSRRSVSPVVSIVSPVIGQEYLPLNQTLSNSSKINCEESCVTQAVGNTSHRESSYSAVGQQSILAGSSNQAGDASIVLTEAESNTTGRLSNSPAIGQENQIGNTSQYQHILSAKMPSILTSSQSSFAEVETGDMESAEGKTEDERLKLTLPSTSDQHHHSLPVVDTISPLKHPNNTESDENQIFIEKIAEASMNATHSSMANVTASCDSDNDGAKRIQNENLPRGINKESFGDPNQVPHAMKSSQPSSNSLSVTSKESLDITLPSVSADMMPTYEVSMKKSSPLGKRRSFSTIGGLKDYLDEKYSRRSSIRFAEQALLSVSNMDDTTVQNSTTTMTPMDGEKVVVDTVLPIITPGGSSGDHSVIAPQTRHPSEESVGPSEDGELLQDVSVALYADKEDITCDNLVTDKLKPDATSVVEPQEPMETDEEKLQPVATVNCSKIGVDAVEPSGMKCLDEEDMEVFGLCQGSDYDILEAKPTGGSMLEGTASAGAPEENLSDGCKNIRVLAKKLTSGSKIYDSADPDSLEAKLTGVVSPECITSQSVLKEKLTRGSKICDSADQVSMEAEPAPDILPEHVTSKSSLVEKLTDGSNTLISSQVNLDDKITDGVLPHHKASTSVLKEKLTDGSQIYNGADEVILQAKPTGGSLLERIATANLLKEKLTDGSKICNRSDKVSLEAKPTGGSLLERIATASVLDAKLTDGSMLSQVADPSCAERKWTIGASGMVALSFLDETMDEKQPEALVDSYLRQLGVMYIPVPPRSTGAPCQEEPMSILDDKLEMLATSRPQLRSYELARTKLSAFVKELEDAKNSLEEDLTPKVPDLMKQVPANGTEEKAELLKHYKEVSKANKTSVKCQMKSWELQHFTGCLQQLKRNEHQLQQEASDLKTSVEALDVWLTRIDKETAKVEHQLASLESTNQLSEETQVELVSLEKELEEEATAFIEEQQVLEELTIVKEDLEHQCARLEQEAASKKTKLQEISDKKSADNLVADLEDQFAQVQRCVPWRVDEWDETHGDFEFLKGSLVLHLKFGDVVNELKDYRNITDISFEAKKGKWSEFLKFAGKLLMGHFHQAELLDRFPTTQALPQLLLNVGVVACEARSLAQDMAFISMFEKITLKDTSVKVMYSSWKAHSKFFVKWDFDPVSFMNRLPSFSLESVIGKTSREDLEIVMKEITPCSSVFKKLFQAVKDYQESDVR